MRGGACSLPSGTDKPVSYSYRPASNFAWPMRCDRLSETANRSQSNLRSRLRTCRWASSVTRRPRFCAAGAGRSAPWLRGLTCHSADKSDNINSVLLHICREGLLPAYAEMFFLLPPNAPKRTLQASGQGQAIARPKGGPPCCSVPVPSTRWAASGASPPLKKSCACLYQNKLTHAHVRTCATQ
jgi:hypothetical protein